MSNDYLGEFEFEMAIAHESGLKGGYFDGKKPRVENLVILSLYACIDIPVSNSIVKFLFISSYFCLSCQTTLNF
jgi:hypothetical protein